MDPKNFLRTIYLGDRALKTLLIDGWNSRVVFQVDQISRIRSASGNWEFYAAEDIRDGLIVLTGAESIRLDPPGFIPNDLINSFSVRPLLEKDQAPEQQRFLFEFSIASSYQENKYIEVLIQVIAQGIHLEDPAQPGIEITE
jgi:hypothetical protein